MATELSSFSITQHQKIAKAQDSHDSWNLHSQHPMEEDDSWEVQAFAEDISNVMGATWPPRSYTCTFCRREFRSAQALGGHMNVHRRDRARLHQSSTSPRILHRFHHNTSVQVPPTTGNFSSGSGLTPYGQYFHEIEPENWTFSCEKENNHHYGREAERNWRTEEVDLELRLGHRPSPE